MYRILIVSCWFGTALATRRLPDFCYDLEGLTLPDDYNPMVSPPLPSSLKEQFFNRQGYETLEGTHLCHETPRS